MKTVMTGNYASAYGAKVCRAEVVAAYPITPQTSVVEKIASLVASGEMQAQYVKVESEHSAMATCLAASMTGARTYTATSSQGLLLMHELLIWASGSRAPVVMSNVSRANGPPWSVWADHHDSMAQRDTGWMQVFCEGNQEVLDSIIMAYKLGERADIRLPTMVVEDAFILSHTVEPVDVPDMEQVDEFLPPYNPRYKLDVAEPYGFGSLVMPDMYMEFRYKINEAMERARQGWRDVERDFEKHFGRNHGGMVEFYRCEDADAVLVIAGSVASTAKDVVDDLRSRGKKVGLARMRVYRPFPVEEIRKLAEMTNIIGVCDRSYTFGHWGPMAQEIRGALHDASGLTIKNYIMGLGGKDITPEILEKTFQDALGLSEEDSGTVEWVGVKGLGGR